MIRYFYSPVTGQYVKTEEDLSNYGYIEITVEEWNKCQPDKKTIDASLHSKTQ